MASTTSLPPGPLRVDNVGVSAGGTRILSRVELTLHAGEMCVLIGPSGAGKSTLIKALLGLRDPDEGSVTMGSRPVAELGPSGYVPQDDALHRGLTVRRELGYAAELRMPDAGAEEREARVTEVLDQVGLADRVDVRIRRLSGGQRKRVSVALELLTRPPLLVLDEPTSGLDPGLEARTMALLSQVAGTGRIVLVATHAMESLDRADALCVLVGGHVAFFGRPRDALSYFRVDRYAALFGQLGKQSPSAWRLTAGADPDQRAFLRRPGPALRTPPRRDPVEEESTTVDGALARLKARMLGGGTR
ncbi:MAG TPA: ABC transporter ATP-binding protein [Longimicrobiales bacterium]|nr:ABC transporter ATP-binding protein [Longimicrobiales bacterium]